MVLYCICPCLILKALVQYEVRYGIMDVTAILQMDIAGAHLIVENKFPPNGGFFLSATIHAVVILWLDFHTQAYTCNAHTNMNNDLGPGVKYQKDKGRIKKSPFWGFLFYNFLYYCGKC